MSYPIFDIDITKPLPSISVSGEDTGVAVLLRKDGKPKDFLMVALPANREHEIKQLIQRINEIARANSSEKSKTDKQRFPVEPSDFPSLTIVISTKDRPQYLARCLEALRKMLTHSHSNNSFIEILVIDNASSDNRTLDVVSSFPEVRYLCEPIPGVNSARNRALNEARGQLLAYLDDDVVVDSGWLSGLMNAWSENPTAAAYTGQVLPYELVSDAQVIFEQRGGFRQGFKKICYSQTLLGNSWHPLKTWTFGVSANMAIQKDILQKLGGFDEVLGPGTLPGGGDDLDIFYRVIRAGHSLQYAPDYLVFHRHRREKKDLRDQYWTWGMGLMTFLGKSFRNDPTYRLKIIQIMVWWFAKQMWQWPKSLLGRHALPPTMILAELWGGIQGLLGGYSRSKRKKEKMQAQLSLSSDEKS